MRNEGSTDCEMLRARSLADEKAGERGEVGEEGAEPFPMTKLSPRRLVSTRSEGWPDMLARYSLQGTPEDTNGRGRDTEREKLAVRLKFKAAYKHVVVEHEGGMVGGGESEST